MLVCVCGSVGVCLPNIYVQEQYTHTHTHTHMHFPHAIRDKQHKNFAYFARLLKRKNAIKTYKIQVCVCVMYVCA